MTRVRDVRVPGVLAAPHGEAPSAPPEFYVMHGLPVSIGAVPGCPYGCAQWSSGRPEPFSEVGLRERGKRLTEAQWRDLIKVGLLGW